MRLVLGSFLNLLTHRIDQILVFPFPTSQETPRLNIAQGRNRTTALCGHTTKIKRFHQRMPSSEILRRVALVRTDVSEELSASIIRVTRICELGTSVRRLLVMANVVLSLPILVTLMMEALSSSETSVLTRATRRNIPEDDILHSHRRENLKSYIALTGWTL
jgi:hypothetical protein